MGEVAIRGIYQNPKRLASWSKEWRVIHKLSTMVILSTFIGLRPYINVDSYAKVHPRLLPWVVFGFCLEFGQRLRGSIMVSRHSPFVSFQHRKRCGNRLFNIGSEIHNREPSHCGFALNIRRARTAGLSFERTFTL